MGNLETEFGETSVAGHLAQKVAQPLMSLVWTIVQRERKHPEWPNLWLHFVRSCRRRSLGRSLQQQDHFPTTNDAPSTPHDQSNHLASVSPKNQQGPQTDRAVPVA